MPAAWQRRAVGLAALLAALAGCQGAWLALEARRAPAVGLGLGSVDQERLRLRPAQAAGVESAAGAWRRVSARIRDEGRPLGELAGQGGLGEDLRACQALLEAVAGSLAAAADAPAAVEEGDSV